MSALVAEKKVALVGEKVYLGFEGVTTYPLPLVKPDWLQLPEASVTTGEGMAPTVLILSKIIVTPETGRLLTSITWPETV